MNRTTLHHWFLAVLVAAVWFLICFCLHIRPTVEAGEPSRPVPGVTIPVEIIEVYDGDTVTIRYTVEQRVRLLDCWAPEIRTTDAAEKERGFAARDYLRTLTGVQSKTSPPTKALLHVPLSDATRVDDVFTLGRVLGHVYLDGETQSLSARMVEAGHATKEKQR